MNRRASLNAIIVEHALCRLRRQIVLIGWSFGGNVALEIARQLDAANLPPVHTILLDSFVILDKYRGEATADGIEAAYQVLRAGPGES